MKREIPVYGNALMKALEPRSGGCPEGVMGVWDLIRPDRSSLDKLRRISIRSKSWFSKLSLGQRRFIELVIKLVQRIRSRLLLRSLAPLVMKLLTAVGRSFRAPMCIQCGGYLDEEAVKGALSLMDEGARMMMRRVAKKICLVAEKWGNNLASQWMCDAGFIKYLIVMSLPWNTNPPAFTVCLG